ncbi:TPA: ABC transporter permease, partial [archaeon]|nr:ABC transporter permease [Candidatus Naiadarchaeales archaeon SRR2090153.bin1042]
MRIVDIVTIAVRSLTSRRLRSWLTILGVVIGVAAVVGLVSIGQGFKENIEKQLSGFGGDLIFVSPGHTRSEQGFGGGPRFGDDFTTGGVISGNLTENDLRLIRSVPGVFVSSGLLNRPATLRYVSEISNINVQGVDPSIAKVFSTVVLDEGRYLLAGDDQAAVLGHNVANELFKDPIKLNTVIFINSQAYRVVGILRQSGQASPTDNLVILPVASARRVFSDFPRDQYSSIVLKVSASAVVKDVASQIEKRLFLAHHVTKDTQDFTILTSQSILETIGQISTSITFFLGGIAAISLLVGGIGIANTMFMSVIERTRQIGVLKSLGATNFDVSSLFLTESGILGLMGGIFGVILGYF